MRRALPFALALLGATLASVACGPGGDFEVESDDPAGDDGEDVDLEGAIEGLATLRPASTTASAEVEGSPAASQAVLHAHLDEPRADDSTTSVRTRSGVRGGLVELGYAGGPAGAAVEVTARFRARRTTSAGGTARLVLFDGDRPIAEGRPRSLKTSWTTYRDSFTGLHASSAANLRTRIVFDNVARAGRLAVTQVYIQVRVAEEASGGRFFDDLERGAGAFTDWFRSPGWIAADRGTLAVTPPAAARPSPAGPGDTSYTHAALAVVCPSRDSAGRCARPAPTGATAYEARVATLRQTRAVAFDGSNQPNAWEVAWLMFRFRDERHYYYAHLKAHHLRDLGQDYGGVEIGKYNCAGDCGLYETNAGQEVLFTKSAQDLAGTGIDFAELGRWYRFRVETRDLSGGSVEIVLSIDGREVARFIDGVSPLPAGGTIGLYAEDADARFDDVLIEDLE